MPTTPVYAFPYPAATDPADVPADIKKLADQVALVLGGTQLAAPPASPTDGQLWFTQPPTQYPAWMFRYVATWGDAYKWQFAGGSPIISEVPTAENVASAAYVDAPTVGPSITAPRTGYYVVEIGALLHPDPATANEVFMSYAIGGTAAVDADAVQMLTLASAGAIRANCARATIKLLNAGTVLTAKYRSSGGGSRPFSNRWMRLTPIRVS